jgi:hypothetical protein
MCHSGAKNLNGEKIKAISRFSRMGYGYCNLGAVREADQTDGVFESAQRQIDARFFVRRPQDWGSINGWMNQVHEPILPQRGEGRYACMP